MPLPSHSPSFPFVPTYQRHAQPHPAMTRLRRRASLPCLVVATLMCGSSGTAIAFQQPPHLALARRLNPCPHPLGVTGRGTVAFHHAKHVYVRQSFSGCTVAFASADGPSSFPAKTPPPAGYKPKVWAYYRSRSKIIEWYMQELGIAYDAVQIDMGAMGHKDPDFIRDVNPFGKSMGRRGSMCVCPFSR